METTKLFTDANADLINELLSDAVVYTTDETLYLDDEYVISLSFCKAMAVTFESIHKVPYNALSQRSFELLYGTLNLNFIKYLSHTKLYKIINWDLVSKSIRINFESVEDCAVINEHIDKINWDLIWKHQIVPEDAIECFYTNSDENEEFEGVKFNWDLISKHQKLSNEFLAKYADKINWDILLKSDNIPYFSFTKEYQKELLENNYRDPRPADFTNPADFTILMTFKNYTDIETIVRISVFS